MRVLAVADADSYLKWSASTLDRLPRAWTRTQVLLGSPIAPSAAQARAATGRPVSRLSLLGLHRLLRHERPDVLLLACTGPTVALLADLPALRGPGRPVLVTGLPGISIPASTRAVGHRRSCDLLVVHSRREQREFARLASAYAPGLGVALSGLPFLTREPVPDAPTGGGDVVFAAQATVPAARHDREAILLALADVRPAGAAVVKVRALPGEQQTHHEELPYADLWDALRAAGAVRPDAVRFAAGSMSTALATARCLVTVSSTAALEAIDLGVPVVVLTDFGVSDALINTVFVDSGCLGDLADVRAGRVRHPAPAWREDNYFHPAADDDLVGRIEDLLEQRQTRGLPDRRSPRGAGRESARAAARLLLPAWAAGRLRAVARRAGRLRAALRVH